MFSRLRAARTSPLFALLRVVNAPFFAVTALVAAAPTFAQETAGSAGGKNSIALQIGALGIGVEYSHSFGDRVALRGALYGSQAGFDGDEGDIDYTFDLIWDSFLLGIDVHPGKGPFRLSGGYLRNDNRLEAVSTPTSPEEIGDTIYTPAMIGTLNGFITFDDSAAFGGLGGDWSRNKDGFGMSLDLGVVSQGNPLVDLQATGTAANNPAFQQDLAAEEAQIQEDVEGLELVPYISLGFVFRF